MVIDDYLKRLSELTIELDDTQAALLVLSLETDSLSVVYLIRNVYRGTLDKVTTDLCSKYAMFGMDFSSIKIALEYLEKKILASGLQPSPIPDSVIESQYRQYTEIDDLDEGFNY